ncbi:MAG: hypothetical protein JWQ96_2357 [Segetibacter sp.]|nr:hypothetical protein [Segetibacter sp.]
MKPLLMLIAIVSMAFTACNKNKEYVDLKTGETILVDRDPETGFMVNTETGKPVYLYVNTSNHDTLYGRTGKVVNKKIVRQGESFVYNDDEEYVYKNGDYKLIVEEDGDSKEKFGDTKIKRDGDGDYKIKVGDDYKKKVEADGDVKIKDGDKKTKIDEDGTRKVKVDD